MSSTICLTCRSPVHWSTKICPNCGRRDPTLKDEDEKTSQEKAAERDRLNAAIRARKRARFFDGIWGLVKLMLLIAGAMLAFRFCHFNRNSGNHAPQSSVEAPVATQGAAKASSSINPSGQESSKNLSQPAALNNASDESDSSDRQFPYEARLIDDRGAIVVQSRPTIAGKNVAKLDAGTKVYAASQEGKWIQVRTENGDVGYVRQTQLDFKNN